MQTIYDLELAQLILKELKFIYKIDESNVLYKYIISRYLCSRIYDYSKIKKDLKNILHNLDERRNIVDFFLNELDIVTECDFILYKNAKIYKYKTSSNSVINTLMELESICVDIFMKNDFFNEVDILLKKIYSSIKRKSFTKKSSKNYNYYLVYYALQYLNKEFKINEVKESSFYKHIEFVQSMPSLRLEDRCSRYIDATEYEYNDALKIDEDILEKYIYKNLDLIEPGLQPIKKQYIIKDGRIDILARDKNGIYTIIELKVENDTDLIFQCVHYPSQLKLEKNLSEVRMITISPEYTYGVLNSIKQLALHSNIESYICLIKVKGIKNKKIDSIKLIKAI